MTHTLSAAHVQTLQTMEQQAKAGQIGFWEIYEWLAETLENEGVASSDQTVLWLRGAAEANANRGAMASMIREYTQTQYELRYGTRLTREQMQAASDEVAQNLLDDLLGRNPPWPAGQVPDITRIAEADATAVGETLFKAVGDTSAPPTNSAWSGTLLFSQLGSDQTGRLMSTGSGGAIDTLNDLRDVLYAFVGYANGLKAAYTQFVTEGALGQNSQQLTDLRILGKTWGSYLAGPGTYESLFKAILDGTDNPALYAAFECIGEVGANRFLDMVRGAAQGKAMIGTTTDANFADNARDFFGSRTPEQLQGFNVRLLPTDAASLIALAVSDVNVRAALAGLSIVSVQVESEVAAGLSLYDPNTNTGDITEDWIRDRAEMTSQVARQNWSSTSVVTGQGVSSNAQYIDIASGAQVLIGAALPQQRAQIVFGDQAANTLTGYGLADKLYGGAGDDTIEGQGGNDYLEGDAGNDILIGGAGTDTLLGGTGNDTYRFAEGWGFDTIRDGHGQNSIEVEGLGPINGTGAKKVAEGVWQTDDKRINYTLVAVDAQRNDLLITFSDRPDVIRIQGWSSERNVGITLDEATTPAEPLSPLIGDFEKAIVPNTNIYDRDGLNYKSSGNAAPGAADLITGTSDADTIRGLGGNDALLGRGGDDNIDGDDGNDVLMGGVGADTISGGAGIDIIYGSSNGTIPYLATTNDQAPTSSDPSAWYGFSWYAYAIQPQSGLFDAGRYWLSSIDRDTQDNDAGNVIDAGAGNDDVAAGTGNDIVHGGDDDDDILGMAGSDILFGDDGDDLIAGDGDHQPLSLAYAAAEDQGNDVIDGGAGNDELWGQGGSDELYGGIGADTLRGDDIDATSVPISVHGKDYLDGGEGNDELYGGGQDDDLFGGTDHDTLYGDDEGNLVDVSAHGSDYLDGEDGNDELRGQGNADTLFGGSGDDSLWGDDSQDRVAASAHGGDYLDGEDGNDTLVGGGGADTLFGGSGSDIVFGDDLASNLDASAHRGDYLHGESGDDTLAGGGGNDTLFGGADNDLLLGDGNASDPIDAAYQGNDYLDGQAGSDTLSGDGGNDTLLGGAGDDVLFGDDGDDSLSGGDGADVLIGGKGNDTLVSDGYDALDGGEGDDTYIVAAAPVTTSTSGVLSVLATHIDDAGGQDSIVVDGDTSGAQMFVQSGHAYLSAGAAGVLVELGDGVSLSNTHVSGSDGASTALQAVVDRDSTSGLVRSAVWSQSSGVTYTSDFAVAQTLIGGTRAEWLQGGYGSDTISGGAGADRLDGGVGADLLDGGADADVLNGGTGADTLRGGSGTDTLDGGDDLNRDMYVFARGDGEDRIVRTALPEGAAKDVIRFDAGITAEDVALRNVAQSEQGTAVESLVISYGLGDRITLEQGAQNTIDRLEFADGTSMTITELLSPLAPDAAPQLGTMEGDVLVGTSAGNDFLRGWEGDDTLQGEAGDDVLQGDTGHNTYRFTGDSGNDTIFARLGEEGTLVFEGVTPAEVAARIDDGRVVISAGNSTVQVIGLPSIAQASQSWQVQIGNEPPVSLGALLPPSELPPVEQDDRRGQFLSAQRIELDEMEQRQGLGLTPGQSGVVPSHVRTAAYGLAAPGVLELPGYLREVNGATTITEHYTRPIYRTVFTPTDNSDEGPFFKFSFVPIEDLLGIHDLPEGSQLVYGPSSASDGGGSSHSEQLIGVNIRDTAFGDVDLIVAGHRAVTRQEVRSWTSDTATQMLVTGTAGDDTFVPGTESAQFRGSIEAGAGNDAIRLLSYENTGPERGALPRTLDWAPVPYAFADYPSWSLYERGRGAWIDAGDGDDTVSGTDAHDVIIGGHGSDWMDGQAGEDTYLISRDPGSTDHIADVAEYPASAMDPVYGPAVEDLHQDMVEFDDSVDLGQLSYRWNGDTLELLQANALFLEIDYGNGPIGEPGSGGIERFVFSDGQAFTLTQLLDRLDAEAGPPVLLTQLPDLSLTEDTPFAGPPLQALFEDPQGQALTFSAQLAGGAPLPGWLSFDPLTGTLSATPNNDQVGGLRIEVTATNSDGLFVASEFNLTVANVNDAPQAGAAWPAAAFVEEGNAFQIDLPAGAFVDVDAGDVLSYSATLSSGEPLPAWLNIDPATGSLTGAAPAGEQSTLAIELHATDLAGTTAAASFSLEVGAVSQIVSGGDASDVLSGGSGDDQLFGGLGDDQLAGLGGDDLLAGEDGADALDGGAGNDALYGGADADTLNGGFGDDVVSGGAGDDMLVDTEGNDVYAFGRGDGRDWIAASETLSGSTSLAEPGRINTLRFDAGISPDDIELRRTIDWRWETQIGDLPGNLAPTLQVGIAGTDDVVNISRYFSGNNTTTWSDPEDEDPTNGFNPIQRFEFADGTVWDYTDIAAHGYTGTAGPDILFGTRGNDDINGRGGNDVIINEGGDDTYHLDQGSGADQIIEFDDSYADVLKIGQGINAEQLWFRDVDGDLEVSVIGTSDRVVVAAGLISLGLDTDIDRIELSDGRYLLDADVANLVQAMASFAPPQPGETTLPESYRQDLAPVIAANWHTS